MTTKRFRLKLKVFALFHRRFICKEADAGPEVGKVILKSNGDEALTLIPLTLAIQYMAQTTLTLIRPAGGVYDFRNFEEV
jgi:hypothetical protein